jgi:hypothetical protein
MSTLHVRQPCLIPALVVSSVGAATLLRSMLALDLPNYRFLTVIPVLNLSYNMYFICRLYQRKHVLHHVQIKLDGVDAWPYVVLWPGKKERQSYTTGAILITWLYFMCASDIVTENAWSLVQEHGYVAAASHPSFLYWVQVMACGVVLVQAANVKKREDIAMCEDSHSWTCTRCLVEDSNPIEATPTVTNTRRPRIGILVAMSFGLSASLSYLTYIGRLTEGPQLYYLPALVLSATTAIHHLSFAGRLLRTRRTRRVEEHWPATPAFSGQMETTVYFLGMFLLWEFYVGMAIVIVISSGSLTTNAYPVAIIALWNLEVLVLGAASFQAFRSVKAENKAKCINEGHLWKCTRTCSAIHEMAGADVEKVR